VVNLCFKNYHIYIYKRTKPLNHGDADIVVELALAQKLANAVHSVLGHGTDAEAEPHARDKMTRGSEIKARADNL
jgi:hypothetical protein